MPYSFGLSKAVVHLLHVAIGSWLLLTGYQMKGGSTAVPVSAKKPLMVLGLVSAVYHAYLFLLSRGMKTYNFGLPGWVVTAVHVLNGLVLAGMAGVGPIKLSRGQQALYLVVVGSAAALYHLHLQFFA